MIKRFFLIFIQIVLPFALYGITADGLTVRVPGIAFEGGSFPGGTVDVAPADGTQHLVLNLKTRTLHTLARRIGDGEIELALLTVKNGAVTRIEPISSALPATRIPHTVGKLAKGEPLKIYCFGSSLVENGAGSEGWQRRLFNPAYPDASLRVGSNLKVVNHGVGGTTARYTVALFGTALQDGKQHATSAFDCDLAIVALLPNGGEDRDAVYEGVIRMLRSRGIEVLLLTDNSLAGQGISTGLWGGGSLVRKLADRYGCAVADTAAYMLEAEQRGEKVFADSIHQAPLGHQEWARSIAAVLSPGIPLLASPIVEFPVDPLPAARGKVPGSVELDLSPKQTGGTIQRSASNLPARVYGVSNAIVTHLGVGATLAIDRPDMIAADLIFDASSAFIVEVRSADGSNLLKTIAYNAPAGVGPRPQTRPVFPASEMPAGTDRRYRIVVTEGVLGLYAAAYHLPLSHPETPK
jgi:hypothetical protein